MTIYTELEICQIMIGLVPICVCAIKMALSHETKTLLDYGKFPLIFYTGY